MRTAIRAVMVAAAAGTLLGGVAVGSAQAQQMVRPNSTTAAVQSQATQQTTQPNTRDMRARARPNTAVKPSYPTCTKITADGVNIRRTQWGTVIGTAYHTDDVSNWIDEGYDGAGNYWYELVDYTQGNTMGWVFGQYVDTNVPWWNC